MSERTPHPVRDPGRRGFSLIEVLMVAAVLGMMVLVAAPSLVRTFRGVRLSTSVRTLTQAHRQARAMSSLRQEQMAIILDSISGRIELVRVLDGESPDPSEFPELDDFETPRVESEWVRWLADRIRIVECRGLPEGQVHDGIYWIRYYSSGIGDGFELRLADEEDRTARLKADAITGRMEVAYE